MSIIKVPSQRIVFNYYWDYQWWYKKYRKRLQSCGFERAKKLKENIEIVVLLVVIGTLSGIILQMLGINF